MIDKNKFPAKVIERLGNSSNGYKKIVINRGREDGIVEGQTFIIYALGKELFDPDTKESLGFLEIIKGKGYASHVQNKMTTITSKMQEKKNVTKTSKNNASPFGLGTYFLSSLSTEGEKEEREEISNTIPFENVQNGDLAKPI